MGKVSKMKCQIFIELRVTVFNTGKLLEDYEISNTISLTKAHSPQFRCCQNKKEIDFSGISPETQECYQELKELIVT